MQNQRQQWQGLRRVVALAAAALVLTACGGGATADPEASEPTGGDTPSEGGDVTEAAADIPEISLQVQSAHGPDAAASRAYDAWAEAVEAASGGQMTFEMVYASALAPILEVEDALASGLFDIGTHAPLYNAARFPVDSVIQGLNGTITPRPLAGTLQGVAAQVAFSQDELYTSPFEAMGVQPLVRPMAVIPVYHLGCAGDPVRSLEEAQGKRVRVPSEHHAAEASALGMTPTATTISEIYESLERGVVDCILAPPADIRDLGLLDVIDHWVIDPEVMFTGVSGVQVSISQETWDALPVAAQRVLWDTAGEVFIPTMAQGVLEDAADSIEQARDKGVEFHALDDDARAALQQFQQEAITSAASDLDNGEAFAARFVELHDQWLADMEDLGLASGVDDTFESFDVASVDFEVFADTITEIRSSHRP